jgi:hypothetical protein
VPVAGIRPQWPEDRRTAQYGQNACLAFSFATSAVKAGGAGTITPAPPRTGHVSSGSANYIRVIRAPQPERLRSRRCAAPPTPEGSAARCSRVSVPAMAFAGAGAAPLPLSPCLATMVAGQDAGDATGCSACAPLPARPALSAGGVGLWATTGVSGDLLLMVVPGTCWSPGIAPWPGSPRSTARGRSTTWTASRLSPRPVRRAHQRSPRATAPT